MATPRPADQGRALSLAPARAGATLSSFVLHRYDWSETSLVLELFTLERGRLAVVAKGAKRPYSQLRSVLLPFQRIHVMTTRGSSAERAEASELQTLRSAEWAGGLAMFHGAALFSGFYLNELLMKLLARQDPYPLLFEAYAQTLVALHDDNEVGTQAALRAFELRLLNDTGVLPDLSCVTATQRAVELEGLYRLTPDGVVDAGGALADDALMGRLLVGIQAALLHGHFPALQQACRGELTALKVALRGVLHYHLGSSTLRTRQLMQDLQSMERRNGT
ncbi:MAG: DNA repair protein RecO [Pseudomonadota bacterium]